MSINVAERAAAFACKKQYTVFRRKTGEPVSVRLTHLADVSDQACRAWKNYMHPYFFVNQARDQVQSTILPVRFDVALMEGNVLHGYACGEINPLEASARISQLYTAPWNVAGRLGDSFSVSQDSYAEQLRLLGWKQTERHADLAVSGIGWMLMACVSTCLYRFMPEPHQRFMRMKVVSPELEALPFYQDLIGMDFAGDIEAIPLFVFLWRAWEGEAKNVRGWNLLKGGMR